MRSRDAAGRGWSRRGPGAALGCSCRAGWSRPSVWAIFHPRSVLATVDMTVSKAETRRWPWSYPWEPGRHPRVCISQNPQQPRPASETDSPWDREPSSGQRAAAGARPPCVSSFSPARVPGSFLVILADVTCEFARREVLPAPECMCACV